MVELVERYGAAIEYDLHDRFGLDLLDFFRHRYSWRKLETLLWQLPSGTAFWAARADDDETAAAILKHMGSKPGKAAPPALIEMDRTNQTLLDVLDTLQVVVHHLEALGGGKPNTPTPSLRPETGMSRARRAAEHTEAADLVAEAKAAQERAEAAQGPR